MNTNPFFSSEKPNFSKVHIRWMIRRDMAEVLAIEADSFEYPWSEDDFIRCLRQRNVIGMVAELDDRIVGFMVYELGVGKSRFLTLPHRTCFAGWASEARWLQN